MDYEKKYKEALELARKLYNMRGDWTNLEIESIFPELRKSEDEKIRKFLIQMAQNGHGEDKDWWNKCVSWLEKQGEQKPAEWGEEDERNFDIIYGIIYNSCNAEDASRLIAWLKSLKDRVQPKQAWSEEVDLELVTDWFDHIAQIADDRMTLTGQRMTDSHALDEIKCIAKNSSEFITKHYKAQKGE